MLYAKVYPEGSKGGRGKTGTETDGFSKTRLKTARAVLRLAEKFDAGKVVDAVIVGDTGLDEALADLRAPSARARKPKLTRELLK